MYIIKYTFGFAVVAMGEPHPCRDPHPRKSRYSTAITGQFLAPTDIVALFTPPPAASIFLQSRKITGPRNMIDKSHPSHSATSTLSEPKLQCAPSALNNLTGQTGLSVVFPPISDYSSRASWHDLS